MQATIKEKILIHLKGHENFVEEKEVPYVYCQAGISETINASQSRISRVLREIIKEGFVKEERGYIKEHDRKRKVYFLTYKGKEMKKKIRKKLLNQKITIITSEGEKKISCKKLKNYISDPNPLLYALTNMKKDKLDLTEESQDYEFIFVDRKEEFKKLENGLKKVKEEGASAIFIAGEAGSGKTTLVNELVKKVKDNEDIEFLNGKAYYGTSDPYLPLKKAFENSEKKANNIISSSILKDLSNQEGTIDGQKNFTAERHSIFFEFSNEVKKLAQNKPLLIFLDNLQWGDKATFSLLNYLVEDLSDCPIFFICAYRQEAVSEEHPLSNLMKRLSRIQKSDKIFLEPLERKDVRKFLGSFMDSTNVPDDFIDFIYSITGGNPLFVKEFIKFLKDEEKLPIDTINYPTSKNELDFPEVIEDIILHRLNSHLSIEAQKIISIGSIIGNEIKFELLLKTSDMDEMELLDIVEEILKSGFWKEIAAEDKFIFTHNLFMHVIYEKIPGIKKKRIHKTVAQNIQNIYEDNIEEYYSDLGSHYEKADEKLKAVEYYNKAGIEAERQYAHDNAIDMYKRALKICQDEKKKKNLSLKLSEIYHVVGELEEARQILESLIGQLEDVEVKQKVFSKLSQILTKQGKYEEALDKVDEGLSLSQEDNDLKCKLLNSKGWIYFNRGKFELAEQTFNEEKEIAEKTGDEKEIAQAFHDLGTVKSQKANYNEALNFLNEAINLMKNTDEKKGLSKSFMNMGNIYYLLHDLDEAQKYYEKSLKIKKEIGDKIGLANSFNNIGVIHYEKGEIEKALTKHKRSLEINEKIGDQSGKADSLNNIGLIYQQKGMFDESLNYFEKSIELRKEIGNKPGLATSLYNIGKIYQKKEKFEKALEYHQKSLEINEELGDKINSIVSRLGLAKAYLGKNQKDKAMKYAQQAFNISSKVDALAEKGRSHKVLGEIHRNMNNLEKANKEFEKAQSIFDEIDDKMGYYSTSFELGLLYFKKGEIEKSKKQLESALNFFKGHEMEWWTQKCKKRLNELQ